MESTKEIRTTLRLDPDTHRMVRAVCGWTGETLSEFVARMSQTELARLIHERQEREERPQ